MKKATFLKIINPILLVSFLVQIISAGLMEGASNPLFYSIHEVNGKVFIVLVIIHFILNFSWIKNTYFKKGKK